MSVLLTPATCRYRHPTGADLLAERQRFVAESKSRKQALRQRQGDTHALDAASKSLRAAVLATWLVDTYGVDYLSSGSGALLSVCSATAARCVSWAALLPVPGQPDPLTALTDVVAAESDSGGGPTAWRTPEHGHCPVALSRPGLTCGHRPVNQAACSNGRPPAGCKVAPAARPSSCVPTETQCTRQANCSETHCRAGSYSGMTVTLSKV